MFHLYFYVFICGVLSLNVKASSLDELKMKYVEMIIECSDTYPITAADTLQLKTKTMPDNESIRCLFACVYKKAGMMNEQGELSVEGVNEMTRRYLSDDPDKIKKSEQFTEACKSESTAFLVWTNGTAPLVCEEGTNIFLENCQFEIVKVPVNDVPVSDGTRGCDRAALIFKCTVEKSPDFDLL